jgi:hypothetical protein
MPCQAMRELSAFVCVVSPRMSELSEDTYKHIKPVFRWRGVCRGLKASAQRRSSGWTDGDSRGAPSGALLWKRHVRVALWLECCFDAYARVLTS